MKSKITKNISVPNLVLIFTSFIGFFTILYFDKNHLNIHLFEYGMPNFSLNYLIRTFFVLLFNILLFWGLLNLNKRAKSIRILSENTSWGIKISVIFSFLFLFILIIDPKAFNILSNEDHIIEWGSAFLLFGTSIVFLTIWLKKSNNFFTIKWYKWISLFLSLMFFIVMMEEVSWFQRVIDFETPEAFNKNLQQEANFHNFNTNYSENLYYIGSFFFLVILPYFKILFSNIIKNKYVNLYIPRPHVILISSIACAYNFDRWDAFITQFNFFSCLLILISLIGLNISKKEKKVLVLMIAIIIIHQIVFLINGTNYLSPYDVKEYKEFLIPLCYFIYSIDIYYILNKKQT